MYKLISFDLDDTLSPAKSPADLEIIGLLEKLLDKYKVSIITWGKFETINMQVISQLGENTNLENLFIFPTIGTRMYYYQNNEWNLKYSEDLSNDQVDKIESILNNAIIELELKPEKVWWDIVENRWSQVTYSALWQEAPLKSKRIWDPDKKIRQKISEYIKDDLVDFSIWIGWTTSIDVTRKGLDKSFWIKKMIENLWVTKEEILFMWDAIFPWWNDYPVKQFWVESRQVENPEDTKKIIKELI